MELGTTLSHVHPEDVGIPSAAVLSFLDALREQNLEVHSYMLLRHGRVASQGWWAPYAPQYPHMLYSLSKSFTSTAAGLAIEEGLFRLDDTVVQHFPDIAPKRPSANLAAMRVRDLLTMSTGHVTEPPMQFMGRPKNLEKRFFTHPVEKQPGTHFLYNSVATYMVSSLVQRTSGQKLVDYLMPRLFEPLGIERPLWEETADGVAFGGWGLNLRTEDIAKFGQLLLQEGAWNGKQLLPRHWVRRATSWQISNALNGEGNWGEGYGFQFWRCMDDCYRGDGMWGQFCIVMPNEDAVLAVTSGEADMGKILECALTHLRPSMTDLLPPDPATFATLCAREAALALPTPPTGEGLEIAEPLLDTAWGIPYPVGEGDTTYLKINKRQSGYTLETRTWKKLHFKLRPNTITKGHAQLLGPEPRLYLATLAVDKEGGAVIRIAFPETPYRIELDIAPYGQDGAKGRGRFSPGGTALDQSKMEPLQKIR